LADAVMMKLLKHYHSKHQTQARVYSVVNCFFKGLYVFASLGFVYFLRKKVKANAWLEGRKGSVGGF
jgi:hypothetical protein